MKKETWLKIGFIAVILNFILSILIQNWYAAGAWVSAFCYLMANIQAIKTLPKTIHVNIQFHKSFETVDARELKADDINRQALADSAKSKDDL